MRSGGTDVIQQYSNYNSQHLPGTITDAAGQDTDITYNSAGQPLTVTNAKSETTTYTYETGTNNLLTVTGPVTGATTTYTYDAYGRVESVEDADGYVVITDYDHLNRLTQRTYPDDTTETNTYSRLDLTEQKDRLGPRHAAFLRRLRPTHRDARSGWTDDLTGLVRLRRDGGARRRERQPDTLGAGRPGPRDARDPRRQHHRHALHVRSIGPSEDHHRSEGSGDDAQLQRG